MKHFFIVFFLLVLFLPLGQGQNVPQPGPGLKQQVAFTMSETTVHKLASNVPFADISPVDVVLLQPHTVQQQVVRLIEEDGDFSASITILNPAEFWPDWSNRVARYELGSDGVRLYKTDGSLYSFLPKTAQEAQDYADMKAQLALASAPLQATTFPTMPTAGDIAQIQAGGGTFIAYPNGSWQVKQGPSQARFEPATHKIIRSKFDGDYLLRSETTEYTFNNAGVLVPSIETVEVPVTRPSGICMQQVTIRQYQAYTIAQKPRSQGRNSPYGTGSAGLQLVPNPATDAITLQLGSGLEKGGVLQVCDLAGTILLETTLEPGEQTHYIELAQYPPGLYFVRLRAENGYQTLKFVKQ